MAHDNRFPHPAAALDPVLYAMRNQLVAAQHQAAAVIAEERRLRRWVEHHRHNAAQWEHRAALAVRAGDDELARAALQRKAACAQEADVMEAQWAQHRQGVQTLKAGLQALGQRIDEAQRQRNQLIARTMAAQARMTVARTVAQLDALCPTSTLSRMEDRVVQLEAEAEAAAGIGGWEDDLEAQFAALEAGRVDDDLAALKAKMGYGPRALPS